MNKNEVSSKLPFTRDTKKIIKEEIIEAKDEYLVIKIINNQVIQNKIANL